MKFLNTIIKHLDKFVLIIALIITTISIGFIGTNSDLLSLQKKDLVAPYSFKGPIDIIFEDGTILHENIPYAITTEKNFKIILNLDNIGMIDNKTISFITKNTILRCEVDNKIIYRNFGTTNKHKYAENNTLLLIDLPKRIKKNKITLYYENDVKHPVTYELKQVKIAKRLNIITDYFLSDSWFDYLVLIFIVVIFVSIIATMNFFKKQSKIEKYFNFIGLLCLSLFVLIVTSMPLGYFVLNRYSVLLYICTYTSIMLIPMLILSALIQRANENAKIQLIKLGIITTAINVIIQYILVFLNINTFEELVKYSYILNIFAFGLMLHLFATNDEKNIKFTIIKISFTILMLGIVGQSIFNHINNLTQLHYFFKGSVLVFCIIQCYDFFSFLIENRDEKIKAQVYKKLALIDKLTEAGNRLALSEKRIDYDKSKASFYIILLDINNLKYINDKFGHKYGDLIIKLLSDTLKKEFNPKFNKEIFRIGGDEFVVIYHAPKNTKIQIELLQLADTYENSEVDDVIKDRFGVSYGYEYCNLEAGDDFSKAMHIADQNMYKDKAIKKQDPKYAKT